MKLRIRENSIRLRLTRSEVERFLKKHFVEMNTHFGPHPHQILTYRLESSLQVQNIEATLNQHKITVRVPRPLGEDWACTEQVALQAEQKIGSQGSLKILIEKDFFCLKPRQHEHEDESDMYPNPSGAGGVCGL